MKRALAERAKQSLNAANAHSQNSTRRNTETNHNSMALLHPQLQQPQQLQQPPPDVVSVHDSNSISSQLPMKIKHEPDFNTARFRPSPSHEAHDSLLSIPVPVLSEMDSSQSTSLERPQKVPRLDLPRIKVDAGANYQNPHASSIPPSPRLALGPGSSGPVTATAGENHTVLNTASNALSQNSNAQPTNHVPPIPAPTARRFSLDPAVTTPRGGNHDSKNRKMDEMDQQPDDKSFYLKHQNRALATELQSLQYAVSQLETERDARRRHCHDALQAIHRLQWIWNEILNKTIGNAAAGDPSASAFPQANVNVASSSDPPSTGTGDSVEWTRALQNSIIALGLSSPLSNNSTHATTVPSFDNSASSATEDVADAYLKQALDAITARATVLEEWIRLVLSTGSVPARPERENGGSTTDSVVTAEQRLHDIQREMAIVTARCTELESQLLEMAASRTEVVSRERRVRRNIYRLAAGMLSTEQVVNTMEEGQEDGELRAAVKLEKQSGSGGNCAQPLDSMAVDTIDDNAAQYKDSVSSAVVDELRARILTLEESVASGESAIQEVRTANGARESFFLIVCNPSHLVLRLSHVDCS
jgi:hypothetical protein